MDSQRNLLVIALLFVSYLLFQQWQHDRSHSHQQRAVPSVADTAARSPQRDIPTGDLPSSNLSPSEKSNVPLLDAHPTERLMTINNDVVSLTIDTYGGDIVQAKLLAYPAALDQPVPLSLLRQDRDFLYQAQSGLVGPDGPDHLVPGRPHYQTEQKHYQLTEQQAELTVPLFYRNEQGIEFRKTFVLRAGEYAIEVAYQVDNRSTQPIEVRLFGQLKQQIELPKAATKRYFALQTYRGAAYSTADTRYQKYDFSAIKKADLAKTTQGGWVAMLQHYFLTAWIPEANQHVHFYSSTLENQQQALIGFQGELIRIPPGAQQQLRAKLWVGPALQDKMATLAKHLDLTVDYGWLWFISQPLFKLLKFLHHFIGNWGLAIIGVTFIVRGIMYPLSRVQYTSMAKMHRLQPKLIAMRERCGDDRQRLAQEMMALYKREKVNPAGGCLPVLIQMPIFLALYWMLMSSVELRHAPFFGWIRDLSAPDPYYLLPLLMGGSMFMIQKMSPAMVTDPVQQKVMNLMPLIFTVLFLWFPSGLVLYYTVSNVVTILQQKMIFSHLEKEGLRQRQ